MAGLLEASPSTLLNTKFVAGVLRDHPALNIKSLQGRRSATLKNSLVGFWENLSYHFIFKDPTQPALAKNKVTHCARLRAYQSQ